MSNKSRCFAHPRGSMVRKASKLGEDALSGQVVGSFRCMVQFCPPEHELGSRSVHFSGSIDSAFSGAR